MTTTVIDIDDLSLEALRGDRAAAIEADENGLIIRPPSDDTLADVLEAWSKTNSFANVHVDKVEVDLEHEEEDERTIIFGEHEVPATERGLEALGRVLKMPVKYLAEIPADEQQFMFTRRLARANDERLRFEYTSEGIETIVLGHKRIIDPADIVERMTRKMPIESPVRDFWLTPSDLRVDAYMPLDWDGPEVGGDPKVGDITQGGIRVFQNRKQNLSPGVRSFTYRLACTNGMEVEHLGIRVDGRNKDEFEFLDEFEYAIAQTMEHLESDIRHFYDMRSQKVEDDRTGVLRRVAQDAGLSDRVVGRLEDRVASLGAEPTMFDFTNLITNLANEAPESNMARTLQRAGGSMVVDHTARCTACHKRL